MVVKPARRRVVLLGRPIEPGAAALLCRRGDPFDQGAAGALPAPCAIDEQILQVADLLAEPAMRVKQIMDDADQRRVWPIPARAKTAYRPIRRRQALPGEGIKLGRQRRLVKIEIA